MFWPPNGKKWLIWKDPDAGKDWRLEKKGTAEDEMIGWHHRLDGHEFEQALGVSDRQGGLACWSPWERKMSDKNKRLIWNDYRAIPLLCIYPEETIIEKDTCIPLFIAALFTIARTWKQPRCPSTDEWIQKSWYIYTMEYYSTIKRNAFESALMRRMNREHIIQSEVNQKEKDKYHILMHIYRVYKNGTEEFIYREAVEKQT